MTKRSTTRSQQLELEEDNALEGIKWRILIIQAEHATQCAKDYIEEEEEDISFLLNSMNKVLQRTLNFANSARKKNIVQNIFCVFVQSNLSNQLEGPIIQI